MVVPMLTSIIEPASVRNSYPVLPKISIGLKISDLKDVNIDRCAISKDIVSTSIFQSFLSTRDSGDQ
ncbi:hypothetical protein ACTXT7_013589 [Hymenolepis weldensis]